MIGSILHSHQCDSQREKKRVEIIDQQPRGPLAAAPFTPVRRGLALQGKRANKGEVRHPPRGVLYSVMPTVLQVEVAHSKGYRPVDPQICGQDAIEASSWWARVGKKP